MVKIETDGNVITLKGPLGEIEKMIVVVEGDDGEVLNVALDDAILMNRTIYRINKPLLNERDKLKLRVTKLEEELKDDDCDKEEGKYVLKSVILPSFFRRSFRKRCINQSCPICREVVPIHL